MQPADPVKGVVVQQGFFVVRSENDIEAIRPHALELIAAARAAPGCKSYSIAADASDSRIFRIFGYWEDDGARQLYLDQPARRSTLASLRQIVVTAFNIKLLRPEHALLEIDVRQEIRILSPEEEAGMSDLQRMQQVVQAHFQFETADAFQSYYQTTMACTQTSRKEPGSLEYCLAQDLDDPSVARLTERWSNVATMYRHIKAEHALESVRQMRSFKLGPSRGVHLFYIAPRMESELSLPEI